MVPSAGLDVLEKRKSNSEPSSPRSLTELAVYISRLATNTSLSTKTHFLSTATSLEQFFDKVLHIVLSSRLL